MDQLPNMNQSAAITAVASRADVEIVATPLPRAARLHSAATPGQVLAIVCVGIVLANLDLFIVNVALPHIARDFNNTTLDSLSWILNGYAIAYAALLVFFGRLAERHRRDRSFLLGVALFTIASAACAAATSVAMLVAFRIAQAAGAALMTPTSIGLLLASFPPERRAAAVRNWAAIGGLAAAAGPLVGGVLVTISWRWIFIVNVPIGLIAILIGWWKLPEVPGHDVPRPNPIAAALVTAGIAALTFAIVKVNEWGWTSPGIAWSAIISAACLGGFIWHCLRSDNPFVAPALFRVRQFTGAALVMGPYSVAFGATLFSAAVWGQTAWGWSALKAGIALAPGPFLVPVTSLLLAGRLIARYGVATVITAGIGFFVSGLVFWAAFVGLEFECAGHHDRHRDDRRWRRTHFPDVNGGRCVFASAIILCNRLRRDQHDPPGRPGNRRRDIRCCRGISGISRGASRRLSSWLVDHGLHHRPRVDPHILSDPYQSAP